MPDLNISIKNCWMRLSLRSFYRHSDACMPGEEVNQLAGFPASPCIGETISILNFSKSTTLDIHCMSLPPGTYRLDAFAELRYEETTPGPTASLKGGLLQVY